MPEKLLSHEHIAIENLDIERDPIDVLAIVNFIEVLKDIIEDDFNETKSVGLSKNIFFTSLEYSLRIKRLLIVVRIIESALRSPLVYLYIENRPLSYQGKMGFTIEEAIPFIFKIGKREIPYQEFLNILYNWVKNIAEATEKERLTGKKRTLK